MTHSSTSQPRLNPLETIPRSQSTSNSRGIFPGQMTATVHLKRPPIFFRVTQTPYPGIRNAMLTSGFQTTNILLPSGFVPNRTRAAATIPVHMRSSPVRLLPSDHRVSMESRSQSVAELVDLEYGAVMGRAVGRIRRGGEEERSQ